jgi:hypothetical protein
VTVTPGGWLKFASVDFGSTGSKTLRINLSTTGKPKGLKILVRIDQPTGALLASLTPGSKARIQTAHTKKIAGVHDLFVSVTGKSGAATLNWLTFQLLPSKKK